jgi:hypothetical protein
MSTPTENRQNVPDGQFHHRTTRMVNGSQRLGFEWHGGAYIEVCRGDAFAHPREVINVWDYAADGPLYPRTIQGMTAAVNEWIDNYGPDDLVHDVTHNWT